jgi:hypothetical protein
MDFRKLEEYAARVAVVLMAFLLLAVFVPAAKAHPGLVVKITGPLLFVAGYWMASRGWRILRSGQLVMMQIVQTTEVPKPIARLYGAAQLMMGGLSFLIGLVMSIASIT